MQPVTDVSVLRQDEYRVSPQWQAQVVESVVNRYQMKIKPLSFTEQRAAFQWRSPGVGTILSPNLFIETHWEVSFPAHATYSSMMSPILQPFSTLPVANDAQVNETYGIGYGARVCFGSGDAFKGALTNYQLVVNGQSISNSRMNTYSRSLDRCWFPSAVLQKRFSGCGGLPFQGDTVCVSGEAYPWNDTHAHAADSNKVCAWTADSGTQKRTENLLGQMKENKAVGDGPAVERDVRVITVRWPVSSCGVFNPCGPDDEMAISCFFRNSCLALPHFNSCSLDLLFEDLKENIFRNLSSRFDGADTLAAMGTAGGGIVRLMGDQNGDSQPELIMEYLRLSSWRGLPASANLQCFRASVHNPTKTTAPNAIAVPAAVTRNGVGELSKALRCVGTDRKDDRDAKAATNRQMEVRFDGLVSAQAPSYIFVCFQKSSKMYCLGDERGGDDDAIGRPVSDWDYTAGAAPAATNGKSAGLANYFVCRNTSRNAAIQRFSLSIQSSIGAYSFAGDTAPYLLTRNQLYRDHIRYCQTSDYPDINTWFKHDCCLLIGADSYLRGLTSPGCSFPITLDCTVEYISAGQYIDGVGSAAKLARSPAVFQDVIQGDPVLVGLYPGSSLQVSASSAVLSSQNLSHSQAIDVLSRFQE